MQHNPWRANVLAHASPSRKASQTHLRLGEVVAIGQLLQHRGEAGGCLLTCALGGDAHCLEAGHNAVSLAFIIQLRPTLQAAPAVAVGHVLQDTRREHTRDGRVGCVRERCWRKPSWPLPSNRMLR